MNYKGVIIEESLEDKTILEEIKIVSTKVEDVTPRHKTPWLKKWTLHAVEIPEEKADRFAHELSDNLDRKHSSWYADYKNDKYHYIVYAEKIFKVDLLNPALYKDAKNYGLKIGIPEYQLINS